MKKEICLAHVRSKYYLQHKSEETLRKFREKFNNNIPEISNEMTCIFFDALNIEPICYLNKRSYLCTFNELERLFANNHTSIKISEEMLNHFFVGYNTFQNITTIINDLSKASFNPELKNHLYRFPIYTSILEGCISNLFKFIILFLDQIFTDKNLSAQDKLGPLCDVLNSNNFQPLTNDVNVDIRNSINHGKAIYKSTGTSQTIDFHYSKGNKPFIHTVGLYNFDCIIEKAYDNASGVLLGICTFINNHIDLITVDRSKKLSIPFQLFALSISIPDIRCISASGLPDNKQINIDMHIKDSDRTVILQSAISISILTFEQYNDYQQYMISFRNERLQNSWVRFTNQEVKEMYHAIKPVDKTIEQVIHRHDCSIWDASTENIDLQEIKYFRFPNHSEDDYKINNVEDASIEDRKRLKAHLFIGDTLDKEKILKLINRGIAWLKNIKNPPSATIPHKYGEMEADSIYINVYKNDGREDKELLSRNNNFVCMVDYNLNGETTIQHGGISVNLWNQLHHEKIGNIQFAWREGEYIIRKVTRIGVNDPCPCGSGKKYKRCCKI